MMFFDSYAIIEIIKGNENYDRYKEEIILTNTLNLAEIFYSLLREMDKVVAQRIIKQLNFEFIEISDDIALDSALLGFENKSKNLSYADCIGYVTALKNNFKFITGDKEFKDMDNVEFVPKE
jgi:predicted nucleic acid-binding protein